MTKLIWHQKEDVKIEYGVDRGVFYLPGTDPDVYTDGVVWNGLISVAEDNVGGNTNSYHFDGVKYLDIVTPNNYQTTISAYSAPSYFSQSLGERPLVPGFILTRQARSRFGLSYRTFIGEKDYKIHLVYNALANPIQRQYSTLSDSPNAEVFSWRVDAVPTKADTYRPTAHYILDSKKMDTSLIIILENIIYGTDDAVPRLPGIDELLDLMRNWTPLYIGAQTRTGIADLEPKDGDLHPTKRDGIHTALPLTRLKPAPIPGLYQLER